MASKLQSIPVAQGHPPITCAQAGQVIWRKVTYAVAAALVVSDEIDMLELPPGHEVVDVVLDASDLDDDGTPAIVLAVGFGHATLGTGAYNELIAGATAGQAGGIARMNVAGSLRQGVKSETANTLIGIKVTTAPDSGVAGNVTLAVAYTPKQ